METRRGWARVAGGGRLAAAAIARLDSLQIEGFADTRIEDLTIRVMDLPFADGVLGLDYLSKFTEVCYDFQAHLLKLTREV